MKNKKLVAIVISATILIATLGSVGYFFIAPYFKPIYSGVIISKSTISKEEENLLKFVKEKLTNSDGGIHTNYINSQSEGDITKGYAILSESQGLMLLYDLEKNDKENFDFTLNYIKKNMILDSKLISWRIEDNKKYDSSATIDDLRIVKSLLTASEQWNDISYRKLALKIAKGIRKDLLYKNILIDFNDGNVQSNTATLCYLDLPTLNMLANIDYISWKKTYDEALTIIDNGYISDDLPLYSKSYNVIDEAYDDEESIDTLLSMIVILNKAETGYDVSKSVNWIKNQLNTKGKVFTSYSKSNGHETSNIESTSIYSILLQIGSNLGDQELENIAMNKIRGFQVKNPKSEVYGGYGNDDGKNVYSYDNLNALIAYRSFTN